MDCKNVTESGCGLIEGAAVCFGGGGLLKQIKCIVRIAGVRIKI
jgi:hypothetical protein